MNSGIAIILILFIILGLIVILIANNAYNNPNNSSNIKTNVNNNPDINFNNNSNNNNEKYVELDGIKGYENELMYVSEELKEGSYANQFKEVDYSKMKFSNNQIGFNPEPKCSSGALPFVDVHMNYLLKDNK